MTKYCFEVYEKTNRGQIFKGYKTVLAEDIEQASLSASSNLSEDHMLLQIYLE